jgi:peptidyl serine alpha-galactosyltransferase
MRRGRIANRRGNKSVFSCCSPVMSIAWLMVLGWGVFLLYSYKYWALSGAKLPSMMEVSRFINKTEESILRFERHSLASVSGSSSSIQSSTSSSSADPSSASSISSLKTQSWSNDPDAVHIVFSTDCTPYQDWQTLVMFHSAKVVKQKGPLTRIASGCSDEKKETLKQLYKTLWPNYHVHFTPDFKRDGKTKKKYDFYNKPYGMKHWLENADPPIESGHVIALLDPDMILVRPITTKMAGQQNNIVSKPVVESEIFDRVKKGYAAGQTYGLGAPWVNDNHKKFNRGRICGEGSPCLEIPNEKEGWKYFSVGPPYILERDDMLRLSNTWTTFVPRVYEGYPYLLAEMYAYSMAAAHEKLPHLRMDHFMVSNTNAGGEGWPWVDVLDDACMPPDENGIYYPGQPLPTVVHFCQNYRVGDLQFAKRKMSKTAFSCDHPMLVEPPKDLGHVRYRYKDQKKEELSVKQVKRNAYVLCVAYRSINAALKDYKERMCGSNVTNFSKTLSYRG